MNRGSSAAFDAAYTRPSSVRAKFSVRESRSSGSNTGVGGLVVQDAGFASSYAGHDARAAVTATARSMTLEGRVVMDRTAIRTRANSDGPGLAVRGVFVGGGAATESSDGVRSRLSSTFVMRWHAARPMTVGAEFGRRMHVSTETPNRFGVIEFAHLDDYTSALAGDSTGTLFVTRGDGTVHYTNFRSAVFAQTTIARTDRAEIGAGVTRRYAGQLRQHGLAAHLGGHNLAGLSHRRRRRALRSSCGRDGSHSRDRRRRGAT